MPTFLQPKTWLKLFSHSQPRVKQKQSDEQQRPEDFPKQNSRLHSPPETISPTAAKLLICCFQETVSSASAAAAWSLTSFIRNASL